MTSVVTFTPVAAAFAVAVPFGALAAAVVRRWPHAELLAPRIAPSAVAASASTVPAVRRVLRARMDPSTETGLLLSAAVAVVIGGVSLAGVVAAMVHAHRGLATYDLAFARWGAQRATPASTSALKVLSYLGGYPAVSLLAVGVAVAEHRRNLSRAVVPLLVLVVGGQFAVTNAIKFIVDRARPDVSRLTGFSGSSFPSGHAAASAASYAVFAFLLSRSRSVRVKSALAGVAVAVAVAVASTRVLLGVHWFTDVLAGLFVGWSWFALLSLAFGGRVLRFGDTLRTAQAIVDLPADSAAQAPHDVST